MEEAYFTIEEIKKIEKDLGFITRQWHESLIRTVIKMAMSKGINDLYWNSSSTLDSGNTQEGKIDYFYERFPAQMGFKETYADLRGDGDERLWHMYLGSQKLSSDGLIELSQIPQKYQGAVISILKSRGPYKKEDLVRVLGIIKNKQGNAPKKMEAFFYETSSWSGDQRFRRDRDEIVVNQRLTKDTLNNLLDSNDPTYEKFIHFLYSQQQHFGKDVLGFVLICPINNSTWLINEIQTDTINLYMKEKSSVEKNVKMEKTILDEQSIKDRLEAQGKHIWVPKLSDENFLVKIQEDPSLIYSLPVSIEEDVDTWLSNNLASTNSNIVESSKKYRIIRL